MCFSPIVSLIVFLIELILAAIILLKDSKKGINRVIAVIFLALGFYQFSEFMLCMTGKLFWMHVGHILYTFLPALGIHFAFELKQKNPRIFWVYFFPIAFVLFEFSITDFVQIAECSKCFIKVIYNWNALQHLFYMIYYFGFILAAMIVLICSMITEPNKHQKKIFLFGFLAFASCSIPAFILFVLFPSLKIMMASIYCEFALLFAIFAFLTVYLTSKINL